MADNYAIIKAGKVVNVIVASYPIAHRIKVAEQADDAVCVTGIPVSSGDSYANGKFYRDEAEIIRPLTADEKARLIGVEVTDADLVNIELGQALTDLELRVLELEAALTN